MAEPSHRDIENRLGGLTERVVRIETRVEGIDKSERDLRKDFAALSSRVNQIAEDLQAILGEQQATRRLITYGLSLVTVVLGALNYFT